MTKLSEHVHEWFVDNPNSVFPIRCTQCGDGVSLGAVVAMLNDAAPELSPKDKLMQGYEKIGEARALVQPKRYGRRSAFDSAPRPD